MKYYQNYPVLDGHVDLIDEANSDNASEIKLADTHACMECKKQFFVVYPPKRCKEHFDLKPLYT